MIFERRKPKLTLTSWNVALFAFRSARVLKAFKAALGIAPVLGLQLGCSDGQMGCLDASQCGQTNLKIATWWETGNLTDSLAESAEELHPGIASFEWPYCATRAEHIHTVDTGQGPCNEEGQYDDIDAYLLNAGRDLLERMDCTGDSGASGVMRVDTNITDRVWDWFPQEVLQGLTCGGGLYAVPMGLHQVNHLFYNPNRLEACPSEEVRDGDSLVRWFQCLAGGGKSVLALPTAGCDAQCVNATTDLETSFCTRCRTDPLQFLLENLVLLESQGNYARAWSTYQSAYENAEQNPDPNAETEVDLGAVGRALQLLDRLRPHIDMGAGSESADNEGGSGLTPEQAAEQVINGESALLVMPDWFHPVFNFSYLVGEQQFPGTHEFLFTVDAFAAPDKPERSAVQREASRRWLDISLNTQLQVEFADGKKAVPALTEAQQIAGKVPDARLVPGMEANLTDWGCADRLLQDLLLDWANGKQSTREVLTKMGLPPPLASTESPSSDASCTSQDVEAARAAAAAVPTGGATCNP